MLFLLTQIFSLLLLAAVLGAVLAYWWMKNRQEDVTETYARVTDQLRVLNARPEAVTREELEAGIGLLSSAITALRIPDPDPLNQRLTEIESAVAGFTVPETDLTPLQDRLADLEGALASATAPLADLRNTDLAPLETRLARLEDMLGGLEIPEVDLGPLHSGLARLDLTIAGLDRPATDLGPIESQIGAIEARFSALGDRLAEGQRADLGKVSADLATLSASVAALEMPDLGPIYQRLVSVEHAIASFTVPETNMTPVYDRLAALEESLAALQKSMPAPPDLKPVERRIASLQEAFLTQTPVDLAPVLDAVQAVDSSLDLEAMENRLNAIEYGLAAIHHTLRARPEPTKARAERAPKPRAETVAPPPVMTRTPPPVVPPPPRDADPINTARREDDEANLLVEAAFGNPDELERINGVGPMLCELLHEIGVFYFWQVAEWSPADVEWVDSKLEHFKGRILRDKWVEQAQRLAAQPDVAKRPGS